VLAGPDDDCAVVKLPDANEVLILKTDCVVEGVHFRPNEKAQAIGWKAMARTLSDFAAMAARPRFALVTLIISPERESRWTKELYRGLRRVADRFGVAIVGGETSASKSATVVSISAIGQAKKNRWVSRGGGKVGDALYVTGSLGGSRRKKHLTFNPRIEEALWLAAHLPLHAMMDLSDGLGADLPRLAKASRVGFEIDEELLPRNRGCSVAQAINDGEDYELLFALAPNECKSLEKKWRDKFAALALTRIGSLIPRSGFRLPGSFRGYLHFS
jgi:thiamine-monophosphate kinase